MTLPASLRGRTVSFWQSRRVFFSGFPAVPGGKVDLRHLAVAARPGHTLPSGVSEAARGAELPLARSG